MPDADTPDPDSPHHHRCGEDDRTVSSGQISAAHTVEDLGFALEQFAAVKKELGL